MNNNIKKTCKKNKPLLSIGLTTYNRPQFLKESVGSVIKQSFQDFELLISNDYQDSLVTFKSLGIIPDKRIKIINQKNNLGEVGNLNYLLRAARGHWFIWLSDDDLFDPNFLSSVFSEIDKKSNAVAFFCNYISASKPFGIFPKKNISVKFELFDKKEFLSNYTLKKISLLGPYGVVKTSALKKIGGYKKLGNSFSPYADTLLPILLSEYGSISWTSEPLVFLRTHVDSISCKSINFSAYTSAEEDFINALIHLCSRVGLTNHSNKFVLNMIFWFVPDEWAVLNRNPELNFYTMLKIFISHQIQFNFRRLRFKYSPLFFIFLFLFICKHTSKRFCKFCFNLRHYFN